MPMVLTLQTRNEAQKVRGCLHSHLQLPMDWDLQTFLSIPGPASPGASYVLDLS